MKIELQHIKVSELFDGYADNGYDGVVGYGGNLDIRPKYQREFVYDPPQRDAVIDTVTKGFPLNVLYWADNGGKSYEVIDGQQRIVSICQYVDGDFSIAYRFFHNLTQTEKDKILNYELMVYFCEGDEKEKLDWFETINIAGKPLTPQELRNAVYCGEWVTDAKKYFSRNGCPAYDLGGKHVSGKANRQEILETAIQWAAGDKAIPEYMSERQHDTSAKPLWEHFEAVIGWAKATFPEYRKEMKSVVWGDLYRAHGARRNPTPAKLNKRVQELMEDDDVTNKRGIYAYVLDGKESNLNIRKFDDKHKRGAYERQKGKCRKCGTLFKFDEMHADHITPWSKGGKTTPENCQVLCADCNRRKSAI